MDQPDRKLGKAPIPVDSDFDQLLTSVYDELRRIAHFHQLNESQNLTLQTTALVHEAYLRLVNSQAASMPSSERHMKALTSRIIRRVLVDHARSRNAQKRDPARMDNHLAEAELIDPNLLVDVLDLDAALNRLAHSSRRLERITELRFFGGLTNEEIATELGTSTRTVERDWIKARMYLLELLQPPDSAS